MDQLLTNRRDGEAGLEAEARAAAVSDVPSTVARPATQGKTTRLERWLLGRLLKTVGDPPARLVTWDGQEVAPEGKPAIARLHIRCRRALWKLLSNPLYQFGEEYAAGRLDLEGDLPQFLTQTYRGLHAGTRAADRLERLSRWFHPPRGSSLAQSRENIHHHYDIGNEFYKLWLDERLVYTCAYFADRTWSLEEAQVAKMDHVCRKLRLRPGERVLEAGCGWGALALHMARRYGVTVKAFNISHEQIVYAREAARREGLAGRVEFIEDDWRNMSSPCDAFVAVGMLEHVGLKNYGLLGDVIHRCLRPQGRGLIHTIGRNGPRANSTWIERRIFPGSYPPSLAQAMRVFEPHDFSVLDVENLRLHYAETLRHWLARFERSADAVRAMFDERFVRMWRLYLAGSIAAFEGGSLQLFQILFAPGSKNDIPWTRAALYVGETEETPARAEESAGLPRHPR